MAEAPRTERHPVGPLADLPADQCRTVADGRAIVARIEGRVVAYQGTCLHQQSPLGGGITKDGVLTCPMHFWRYDLETGGKLGEPARQLQSYPVTVIDGEVFVDLPPPPAATSMRDFLLGVARGEIDPEGQ